MMKKKNLNNDLNIGVDYARYSSHAQKDASIEQQVAACKAKAAELGITLIESYEDRAISGKTDKRPNFQRLMKDAALGKFSYVFAWKSNRMGRNMLEAMINEAKLQESGVRVIYVEEDFDDSAAGRFALRSMMNVNQFYSENMAEDIRRGMLDNAMQCKVANGKLPFGYTHDEDLKLIIDEPKDEIVREIYTRVACGEPFVDICARLNAKGIKTGSGNEWGKHSLQGILSNERYRGIYIYGDIRIEGGIPRIISDELYFKVQEVLHTKRNARGRHRMWGDYLLTGKLYCAKCLAPMVGTSGTSRSGQLHHYYTCQKRMSSHDCDKKNVRRDDIEHAIAKIIKDHILQPGMIQWIAKSTVDHNEKREEEAKISILQDELAAVKSATNNMLKAIEQGIITDSTKARLLELESEQATINAKIQAAKADIIPVTYDEIVAGLSAFCAGDLRDKKYQAQLFDTFLVAAYLYDNKIKLVFSFSGDGNTVTIPSELIEGISNDDCDFIAPQCSDNVGGGLP